jgi:hypothetical protein
MLNRSSLRNTRLSLLSVLAGVVSVAAMATTLLGCGDDESSTTVAALGPPAIAITSPDEGVCVLLDDDQQATVRVQIELQNWSLRPEGFCGGVYSQCGFAVFLVDEQEVVRSASLVTDVPLAGLPSPVGTHRIRVELRDDDDEPQLDRDGEFLTAELTVKTVDATGTCP